MPGRGLPANCIACGTAAFSPCNAAGTAAILPLQRRAHCRERTFCSFVPCPPAARRYNLRVRFLHTADWHLGRSFLGVSLLDDQAHVLHQFVALAAEAKVDAVLLAGDIFDRSTPPADAIGLLDETLTRLVADHGIAVVLIAGNHDSGERLRFGSRLLSASRLHVVGTEPCVIPLQDAHGTVDVVAIPFAEPMAVAARRSDSSLTDHDGALRAEIVASFPQPVASGRKVAAARARRVIAVAHAFVSGGCVSESERPLVMGNAGLVGADCFEGFSYAALGHLHRPQRVGRDEVRYSGSLLKYSFDEAAHRKSVSLVEIDAAGACRIEDVALAARHDVRVLEGTLEELQRGAAADRQRDDYVLARLTDRGAVLDPIGKLRVLYPNCLRVDRDAFLAVRLDQAGGDRVDLRSHDETELFDAFFLEVTGEAPAGDERQAFGDALGVVRRASKDA